MVETLVVVARLLHYLAVIALFGAAVFPIYAFRREAWRPPAAEARIRAMLAPAAAIALVTGLLWLAAVAAQMSGDIAGVWDPETLWTVIVDTDFGHAWAARLILTGGVLGEILLRRGERLPAILSAVLLASIALTGHTQAKQGALGLLHMASDAAHLLGAGAWLGGLIPLAALAMTRAADTGQAAALARMVHRFSGMGYAAVAALLVSGVFNSWLLVGSVEAMLTTQYGQVLTVKIGAFLAMLALAAANRFWISPRLLRPDGASDEKMFTRLRTHIWTEQALGGAVLALVAVLGTLPPGAEAG
ncbi:copper homeostasis membrane protein CopD [Phenylobacterium sp.]|uniref:copper homeostasis membrane protein CopD n=1 Tax=Phenylobacterium sp. TaxID=1871053 RepID=UPI002733C228|nr:copper homeostasis membrane protein CopD [Phenylobacterium sp.]MDP3660505.1 copper homeostasis membrane protein CopD [Phenylobacterium sp.]